MAVVQCSLSVSSVPGPGIAHGWGRQTKNHELGAQGPAGKAGGGGEAENKDI